VPSNAWAPALKAMSCCIFDNIASLQPESLDDAVGVVLGHEVGTASRCDHVWPLLDTFSNVHFVA
jgi:hypothetical protein